MFEFQATGSSGHFKMIEPDNPIGDSYLLTWAAVADDGSGDSWKWTQQIDAQPHRTHILRLDDQIPFDDDTFDVVVHGLVLSDGKVVASFDSPTVTVDPLKRPQPPNQAQIPDPRAAGMRTRILRRDMPLSAEDLDNDLESELQQLALDPGLPGLALVEMRVCARYAIDYSDQDPSPLEIDFFQDPALGGSSTKPAWGTFLVVRNVSTGALAWNDWTPWSGPDRGCARMLVPPLAQFEAQILSSALIHDVKVRVHYDDRDNELGRTPWSQPFTPNLNPLTGSTVTVVTGMHDIWRIAAAAGWATKRRHNHPPAGSTYTVDLFDCARPDAGFCTDADASGNGWNTDDNSGYIANTLRMFNIVHELGHGVFDLADDGGTGVAGWNNVFASADACDQGGSGNHYWNTKEYQSTAAVEGWANYYATVAFNKTNESGAAWVGGLVDWDHNTMFENTEINNFAISIEDGAPHPGTLVPNINYYGLACEVAGDVHENRGNEYDWARFLWDADSKTDLTFQQLLELIDLAEPTTWSKAGDVGYPDTDHPYSRFEEAAIDLEPLNLDVWLPFHFHALVHGIPR